MAKMNLNTIEQQPEINEQKAETIENGESLEMAGNIDNNNLENTAKPEETWQNVKPIKPVENIKQVETWQNVKPK